MFSLIFWNSVLFILNFLGFSFFFFFATFTLSMGLKKTFFSMFLFQHDNHKQKQCYQWVNLEYVCWNCLFIVLLSSACAVDVDVGDCECGLIWSSVVPCFWKNKLFYKVTIFVPLILLMILWSFPRNQGYAKKVKPGYVMTWSKYRICSFKK